MTEVINLEDRRNFTISFLQDCFALDENSGHLYWRVRPASHFRSKQAHASWNTRYAGKRAGQRRRDRYWTVRVLGRSLLIHRVIFALSNELLLSDVPAVIDHRDNNPSNNRPANLRAASHTQNSANAGRHRNNTSGYKGVNRYRPGAKWEARIRAKGKRIHLGYFDTPEEAHAAYQKSANELHGQFARAK